MNKVVAVVLNYNSAKDTEKCLKFLWEQDYKDFEVIIVDNNSEEKDYLELEACIAGYKSGEKGIRLIRSDKNEGFSAGNNIGLRYAQKQGAKWALVINPDVELRDLQYITKMMTFVEDKSCAVVAASNVLLPSGKRQNPMLEPAYIEELCWPLETVIRKFKGQNSYLAADKTGYCYKLSGCCFFIKMSFLQQIGFLDQNVFLYCEEPILASTVKKYGYQEVYNHEVTAYHVHIDSKKGKQSKRLKMFRESRRYYWKHYSGYTGIKLKILLLSDKVYCFFKCRR